MEKEKKEGFFNTSKTTSDAIQFNFYPRDKSKKVNTIIKLNAIFFSILCIIAVISLILKISIASYLIQVIVILILCAIGFIIPLIIKDVKLKARGTPYYEIGVDFDNTEFLIKTGASGMFSYDAKKITSLKIVEISSEASMWSIDKNINYKIAHEIISPLKGPINEDLMKIRDNTIVVKLIALMLLNKKDVTVIGPHWNIQNILNQESKMELNPNEYKETINVYKKNENIGSNYYLMAILLSIAIIIFSYLLKSYFLTGMASIIVWYFVYKYISNPGFTKNIQVIKKDSILNEQLMNSVTKSNPDIAYILTVPMNIVNPYAKNDKEMEKILIMGKGSSLFVKTTSGKNLLT